MKRGEIWTVAGGGPYASKPRPAVVIQEDAFHALQSVTICILTSDPAEVPMVRPTIEPNALNGLQATSRLMADKITTVPRHRLGAHIGRLSNADMQRLNQAMAVFLGLASAGSAGP